MTGSGGNQTQPAFTPEQDARIRELIRDELKVIGEASAEGAGRRLLKSFADHPSAWGLHE